MIRMLLFLFTLLLLAAGTSSGQVETLMYDSLPHYNSDTIPVFHDYNAHLFFGYDECTKYIALKYGFVHQYHGRQRRISYAVMRYDWLNRRWSKQMRRRNGRDWVDNYYQELRACRNEAVFQNSVNSLPDTVFAQINSITRKEQLLQVSPLQLLSYLHTNVIHHGHAADNRLVPLEPQYDVGFLITTKDNWIKKSDVAALMQYIYGREEGIRRACLHPAASTKDQLTTVGQEAFKLIALYRGYDYPTSFPTISRAEVDEMFRWWLEERKKP